MISTNDLTNLYDNISFNKLKKPPGLLEEDKKQSNNSSDLSNDKNDNPKKQKDVEIKDRTLIKNFILKWDVKENNITSLPKEMKEKAKIICGNKKLAMTKIDTDKDLKATGTFRCID
tara:strand:+ start:93 stop:443 length:351 start_codon:yes stop_codon:yes gene_type:complete